MYKEDFHREHQRLTEGNNLVTSWNCDYPSLADGLNYYAKEEGDTEDEFNKFLFSITGINSRIEGDLEGFIEQVKKSLLKHGLKV